MAIRVVAGEVPSRPVAILSAAIDVVLGLAIRSWSKESLKTLAVLAGIAFVLRGALLLAGGFTLRRAGAGAGTSAGRT
jgi:uncharacterized membrane protein HdeD (DUF308 family)